MYVESFSKILNTQIRQDGLLTLPTDRQDKWTSELKISYLVKNLYLKCFFFIYLQGNRLER